MLKWVHGLLFFAIQSFAVSSFAADLEKSLAGQDQFGYSQYFVVKDKLRTSQINLLYFTKVSETFPLPTVPYKRLEHFGSWIYEDPTSCINTRARVLVRESKSNVTYKPNGCTIVQGQWDDVYTASEFSAANAIQIDHLVPLKHAYMAGAFEWNFKKRCLYANYMGNKFHLLAVSGKENLQKSDHAPQDYMPPNKRFTCEYLRHWLEVKLIWSLRLTPKEVDAIKEKAAAAQCGPETFLISQNELNEQRRYIADHENLCTRETITGPFAGE